MGLFEKIDTFQPDGLISSINFPILTGTIQLKAGHGVLKRGSLILKTENGGYIAGSTVTSGDGESKKTEEVTGKVFGILTDDIETGTDESGENTPATCYTTGIFNPDAIIISGETKKIADFEDEMRTLSLFLETVQNYDKGE